MTRPEIKEINIREYLKQKGIYPKKDYGYYGMYHCPYREEQNASFKVDYRKNVWHDFGTGEGGSIIDLVMKMGNCSFYEAANKFENKRLYSQPYQQPNIPMYSHTNVATSQRTNSDTFSFHRNKSFEDHPTITIQKIIPIAHPKLIAWIQERKIAFDLANRYCREIHYRNSDKPYFSIGFRNDRSGYELSSPPDFKGCIPPKDITIIRNSSDRCLVFEGFWDFLSYLTIQKIERTKNDVAVLNSVANVQKAMDFLKVHKEIYTYLDNDESGRKATALIKSACSSVYDRSERYAEFKDLNDYLCQKPIIKSAMKKKSFGLKR